MAIPDKFNGNNFGLSPVAQQISTMISDFVDNHGTTVVVSASVFCILHMITLVLNKDKNADTNNGPQPRWDILRAMNFIVFFIFVGSIGYVVFNYRWSSISEGGLAALASGSFVPITLVWASCLLYFFGFFGISFLDTELLSEPSQQQINASKQLLKPTPALATDKKPFDTAHASTPKQLATPAIVPPKALNDTAICAEAPAKPSTASSEGASRGRSNTGSVELDFAPMSDDEVFSHLMSGTIKDYQLEKKLGDYERAVKIRRRLYESILDKKMDLIPYTGYDYNKVFGANCEIVIGYVPLPLGVVGPMVMNGESLYVPMATTEGCLVASTNRGCKAISASGGCRALLLKDAITRAPCIRFPTASRAADLKKWIEIPVNYKRIEEAFNSTTSFGRLDSVSSTIAGRNIYLRFCCMSGDAMGMNMVSKGCLKAIEVLEDEFPDGILVAISGNMCTDKKPSAINWILGRGKSIVVEAIIQDKIVKSVLKTTVHDIIETNKQKNHIGSAMAGSIGGFNAHAANIVTAVFLATGQDPAQNVESSNCLTIMEYADDGQSLHVSVTMPSVEVGTVGGGTHLPAQAGCLDICGVRGASKVAAGDNAKKLALIVGAAVLAGELSLMAALAANHLVRSHMQHNRKPAAEAPQPDTQPAAATMRKTASMPDMTTAGKL